MLKIPKEESALTPIEKELKKSFGFVQNLATAAALNIILMRLEEVELALELYEDDEDHEPMIRIVKQDKLALEEAIVELANLKEADGISA